MIRHGDRPRTRKPGAGRPRRSGEKAEGPVDAAIVSAAARRFAKQGVAATTMIQIAEDVGLGVSSVYYYFGNKAAILGHILDEVNSVPLALLDQALLEHDTPRQQLHAFVAADAAALCTFPYDINEIHRLACVETEALARYWRDRETLIDRVATLIAAGVEQGQFRKVDPRVAALTVLANDEATRNWFSVAESGGTSGVEMAMSPAELGLFLAEFALRGLDAELAFTGRYFECTSNETNRS